MILLPRPNWFFLVNPQAERASTCLRTVLLYVSWSHDLHVCLIRTCAGTVSTGKVPDSMSLYTMLMLWRHGIVENKIIYPPGMSRCHQSPESAEMRRNSFQFSRRDCLRERCVSIVVCICKSRHEWMALRQCMIQCIT